jgi:hypothetical protein
MAELLVMAVTRTHADPVKDARGCYKRGDVVLVMENGHPWGTSELKAPVDGGQFVVIKITDVTKDQVLNWIFNHWTCRLEDPQVSGGTTLARRRIRIDVNLVPPAVLQTLNQTGEFTTTWTAIRQFVHDKQTDTTGSGSPI